MKNDKKAYLARLFNPANRLEVLAECFDIMSETLNTQEIEALKKSWKMTVDLYSGFFPGYNKCNTEYHDYNHTCDVLCATIRMIDGALSQNISISTEMQLDICIGAMLHDSGYIQESGDDTGTGAKYTKTHVTRSITFTDTNKKAFALTKARSDRIGRLIAGTDLATVFDEIPYHDDKELFASQLLASADLLGQMADRTYLEKLLFLYYEFKEAGFPDYSTEFDILTKTLGFYEKTKDRLYQVLGNSTQFALNHFSSRYGFDHNLYLESIERQMIYLKSIMDDNTANFRKKLKRIDLEAVSFAKSHGVSA